MRRPVTAIFVILAFLSASGLGALDVGLETRAGSLQLPWDQTTETTGTAPWSSGLSRWFVGAATWVDIPMGEDFEIHVGYETDPVIRNVVSSLFRFDRGIASVGVGPFAIAITPDSTKVYVTNTSSDTVSVIDTATNAVVGSAIGVGDGPLDIAICPAAVVPPTTPTDPAVVLKFTG